jgi:hypothetical protein
MIEHQARALYSLDNMLQFHTISIETERTDRQRQTDREKETNRVVTVVH